MERRRRGLREEMRMIEWEDNEMVLIKSYVRYDTTKDVQDVVACVTGLRY